MASETTLPLLNGQISLNDALNNDRDIIRELLLPEDRIDFATFVIENGSHIAGIAARHLRVPPSHLDIGGITEVKNWMFGSFNMCLPIRIRSASKYRLPERVIFRLPLPYKVGEASSPGNIDEKLRCEAATYLWLQRNCPSIPIPRLFGFGFPGRQSFTRLQNETTWNRTLWAARRIGAWLRGHTLPPYFAHARNSLFETGYLLIEYIEDHKMLSTNWDLHRQDPDRMSNLFRGLSRIMLDIAKFPLPRIGSWTVDDRGVLSLSNRPLSLCLHQLENAGISTDIPRDRTYASAETYYLDVLTCHDNRIRQQPNSIHSRRDGIMQAGALTGLRALVTKFTDRQMRHGPFTMSLTDLHNSNIFVDDNWNITCIIDLEWACALPLQMLGPPYWLTNRGVDQLYGPDLDQYEVLYDKFVHIFVEEELAAKQPDKYSRSMRQGWNTGSYWFARALDCPDAFCSIFARNIEPRFGEFCPQSDEVLTRYWDEDASTFISEKVKCNDQYNEHVREIFSAATSGCREAD